MYRLQILADLTEKELSAAVMLFPAKALEKFAAALRQPLSNPEEQPRSMYGAQIGYSPQVHDLTSAELRKRKLSYDRNDIDEFGQTVCYFFFYSYN